MFVSAELKGELSYHRVTSSSDELEKFIWCRSLSIEMIIDVSEGLDSFVTNEEYQLTQVMVQISATEINCILINPYNQASIISSYTGCGLFLFVASIKI